MNHNIEEDFDEFSSLNKSTKESDNLDPQFIYGTEYLINQNNNTSDKEILDKMIHIFSGKLKNEEFEDIPYNIETENENTEKKLLGKKHMQESSFSNFTPIAKAKNNMPKEKIFEINKIYKTDEPIYRLDYFKKIFIKSFLKYLLNYGKKLISECIFKEKIGNLKLHMPNYKLYAGNPKEKDNKEFLLKTIKTVFVDYDKKSEKGTSRQKDNEKLINKIYELSNFQNSEKEKKLKNFLELNIEKAIEMYYESKEFENFKNDENNKYYDSMFYKEKNRNFSLLEKNGFIKLVKMPFYSKYPK